MLKPIPKVTPSKELPIATKDIPAVPEESSQVNTIPSETPQTNKPVSATPQIHVVPRTTPEVVVTPEESPQVEELPEASELKEELPPELNEENCVEINGQKIELKPTKLKYFRNKTAAAYNIMKSIPLSELLTVGKGVVDERRDGDHIVYDFLVAAFDDVAFVRKNYNEMNADQVEQVVRIMGRLNHIDEKLDAQRKNREAQGNR